jgi:hypothetical protein
MGQKRPVHVYILITEGTIEENLLATLSAKHELAAAVLDPDSDLSEVNLVSGLDALKRRLELLLGAKPAAAPDITIKEQAEADTIAVAGQQAKVSQAGGQLITAAFSFLAEALPATAHAPDPAATAAIKCGLEQCIQVAPDGQVQLNLTLPGRDALDTLAAALARLMAAARPAGA